MRVSKQPASIKYEWRQQWQQIYDLNKFSPIILHKPRKKLREILLVGMIEKAHRSYENQDCQKSNMN